MCIPRLPSGDFLQTTCYSFKAAMGHSLQNTVWSRHFPSQIVLFSEELYDVFKSPDGVIQPLVSSQPNYAPFKVITQT